MIIDEDGQRSFKHPLMDPQIEHKSNFRLGGWRGRRVEKGEIRILEIRFTRWVSAGRWLPRDAMGREEDKEEEKGCCMECGEQPAEHPGKEPCVLCYHTRIANFQKGERNFHNFLKLIMMLEEVKLVTFWEKHWEDFLKLISWFLVNILFDNLKIRPLMK